MSQKVSRKTISEEKDKRSTNSPVKEMKKKMAANAEKEKQAAAEKSDKVEKTPEKSAEKTTEKADKSEKVESNADKKSEKKDVQTSAEKKKDTADKKKDHVEKKNEPKQSEPQAEKSKGESSKEDKSGKADKEKPESKKSEPSKQKQNGRDRVHNGVSDVTLGNGTDDVLNGTVKAARTPETPRPADLSSAEPKEAKVLKLKEDAPGTDRKLRSADSPKPESKKQESDKKDMDSKDKGEKETDKEASKDVVGDKSTEESKSQEEKEIEVVIEVESSDDAAPRKTDTNYSKSRVKVSPYRRSGRLADQTNTSLVANYTGNNTTMEMDITESSSFMDESNLDDSSYLRGLRSIRGRNSYKPLKEMTLRHVANRSVRSNASANLSTAEPSRPTGTVVGRKRKPDADDAVEVGVDAAGALPVAGGSKRLRVLERLAEPFRRVASATLPATHRRNAPIVGINTDLPLTAPVATTDTFDPESLKSTVPAEGPVAVPLPTPHAAPLAPHTVPDNKRCIVM